MDTKEYLYLLFDLRNQGSYIVGIFNSYDKVLELVPVLGVSPGQWEDANKDGSNPDGFLIYVTPENEVEFYVEEHVLNRVRI
jgi:hypothetical protein